MSQGSDDFKAGRTADAFPYARISVSFRSLKLLVIYGLLTAGLILSEGVRATVFEDADFTETEIARPDGNPWVGVVGLQFVEDGSRAFAWEREGRIWILDDSSPVTAPFLDISDEVLGWRDHGMLGFALDPGFRSNGFVYLLYAVDRHHVDFCSEDPSGTGPVQCDPSNYDPAFSILETRATIGRVTRYQAFQPAGEADFLNATQVDPNSRTVLIGAALGPDACPLLYDTHGVGSLVFGTDGTLLVGCGDSGRGGQADAGSQRFTAWQEGINDGLIRTEENVGAFRAQMVDSLSGKILRIDPATGDGLASNPFFDAAAPRSARSRVWTLGVRNGYRMTVRNSLFLINKNDPGSSQSSTSTAFISNNINPSAKGIYFNNNTVLNNTSLGANGTQAGIKMSRPGTEFGIYIANHLFHNNDGLSHGYSTN